MKYVLIIAGSLLFCIQAAAATPVIQLEELLSGADSAVPVLQAERQMESAQHSLARERAEDGWRAFSSVGYGRVNDVIDEDRTRSYNSARARIGASYPLLGSAAQSAREINAAAGRFDETRMQRELARSEARAEIESLYAKYWVAQESLVVIAAFLQTEPEFRSKLQLRREERMLRESEYQDALLAYEQARLDAQRFRQAQAIIRQRLGQLVGRELGEFRAHPVPFSPPPEANPRLLEAHPSVELLDHRRQALSQQLENSNWYGVDADFEVSTSLVQDTSADQTGGGAFVGLNLSAPFSIAGARDSEQKRLKSEIEALRLQQQDQQQKLLAEARKLRLNQQQQLQKIDFSEKRVASTAALLHERQLRGQAFDNETLVSLAQAMRLHYQAALQDVEIRGQAWQASIHTLTPADSYGEQLAEQDAPDNANIGVSLAQPLQRIATGSSAGGTTARAAPEPVQQAAAPAPALMKTLAYADGDGAAAATRAARIVGGGQASGQERARAEAPTAPQMATYVWDSDLLLETAPPAAFWTELKQNSVNRVLLSLNASQIRQAQQSPVRLRGFLQTAHEQGVAVELLLGDPHWIEPVHRGKLIAIVQSLRSFDFDGLHLDIEPDQIYEQPLSRAQFNHWVTTLAAAAEASPWPTAVDVHPRYLHAEPYLEWRFAEQLGKAGVAELVLMVYQSSPERVAEIVRAIAAGSPQMRFRVAQSVEPQLPPNLSHAQSSFAGFQSSMRKLDGLLTDQANVDGIVVQAWTDLKRMRNES